MKRKLSEEVSTKQCKACQAVLDISRFYSGRSVCKACTVKSMRCQHGCIKAQCRMCCSSGEGAFCVHNRRKSICAECHGSQLCSHKRERRLCTQCCGSGVCEHHVQRAFCKACQGTQVCSHHEYKRTCKVCNDPLLCKEVLDYTSLLVWS
jgi:hypothetical protein